MELITSGIKANIAGINRLVEVWDCTGMTLKNVKTRLKLEGYNDFWYYEEERVLEAFAPSQKCTAIRFSEKGRAIKPDA